MNKRLTDPSIPELESLPAGVAWLYIVDTTDTTGSPEGTDKKIRPSKLLGFNGPESIRLWQKGFYDGVPNSPDNAFIELGDIVYFLSEDGNMVFGVYRNLTNDGDDQNKANYTFEGGFGYEPVTSS